MEFSQSTRRYRMKDLVASMKDRYPDRYVLFDAPPVLSAADAPQDTPHA